MLRAPVAPTQAKLYELLTSKYTLTDDLVRGTDYFLVGNIDGIKYYTPNDEDWGSIIAVDNTNKLAIDTHFYEMDDMEHVDSDYKILCHNNLLMCKFESE